MLSFRIVIAKNRAVDSMTGKLPASFGEIGVLSVRGCPTMGNDVHGTSFGTMSPLCLGRVRPPQATVRFPPQSHRQLPTS